MSMILEIWFVALYSMNSKEKMGPKLFLSPNNDIYVTVRRIAYYWYKFNIKMKYLDSNQFTYKPILVCYISYNF